MKSSGQLRGPPSSQAAARARSERSQSGYSILPSDCDDGDADRNPGALELCNAIDDDCSGEADYELGVNDWEDDDGDGFPDVNCPGSGGTRDCDDTDPATYPGQFEICDLRDNDCDGTIDESSSDERPDAGVDAGVGMDAGVDAGSVDAGSMDAGTVDAGPDVRFGMDPLDGVRELAVGPRGACARRADGTVACWGRGELLGDGFAEDQGDARLVDGLMDAAHVAVGSVHACASTTTGSGYCWGNRMDGRLGGGSFGVGDVATSPESVSISANALLGLSSSTSVAATDGGSVVYWGSIGIFDSMLMGTTYFDRPRLTGVPASGVTGVEVGGWACFLYADGSVRCYGGGSDEGLVDL